MHNKLVLLVSLLLTVSVVVQGIRLKSLENHLRCLYHDFTDTEEHFFRKNMTDSNQNRGVNYLTDLWHETLLNGLTHNKQPFNALSSRDPQTILRMAEYQTMIYCRQISLISEMAKKNLRVGSFKLEAVGNDSNHRAFWYLASNDEQKQLTLVHRGTVVKNRDDVLADLDPLRSGARHQKTFRLDFPYLEKTGSPRVSQGFHLRFKSEQRAIESAVRTALKTYPSYSFVIVGHSLGAAWAYLNAGYFAGKQSIPIAALYTFGQPLLGNAVFVDQLARKIGVDKIIRVVNKNDVVPHLGCVECQQPKEPSEKWISLSNAWIDCQGGHDMKCSSGLPCKELSWTEHSAVGNFRMSSEFCQIKINSQ